MEKYCSTDQHDNVPKKAKPVTCLGHIRYSTIKAKDRFLLTLWLMNFDCQHTNIYSVGTRMNWNKLYPKMRQDRAWSFDKTHPQSPTKGALAKIRVPGCLHNSNIAIPSKVQLLGVMFIKGFSNPVSLDVAFREPVLLIN